MAYVRKVRTASGAVAVQVARKDRGRVVILAHLGSAHTDAELGILLEQARAMVVGGQAALDFEVAARAQSMADVAGAEPVWNPDSDAGAWRAIWAYSAKRARRDQKTLAAQEARARAIVAGEKKSKTARFVRTRGDHRALDEASLARAQSLVGLKGYVTNVPVSLMPAAEVIAKYHDLWHVEKSFRMSKTDLDARPMFNRMRDAIEAHLTIVFAALAVSHAIQSRTGLSTAKVVKLLRPLRCATITINGATQTFPPAIPDTERKILTDLGFKPGY